MERKATSRSKFAAAIGAGALIAGLLVTTVAPSAEAATKGCGTGNFTTIGSQGATTYGPGALCLTSGPYKAVYQSDSNFVVYKNSTPLWASNTAGTNSNRIALQGDSNLVIYNNANGPLWASYSQGGGWNGTRLEMQSDGNLVIYGIGNGTKVALWASNTRGR
ncbi:mannose-binding protein [Microbacteriaceae bacterium VKM Ac-2854]|nr:mannose-binding protein [Microbacteriaceae bacterium VKM Ac-2854]